MNPRRALGRGLVRRSALVMAFVLSGCAFFAACGRPEPAAPANAPLGDADAERGRRLMAQYQCGSCHVIPQVPAAAGRIGPSLEHFGVRSYIAGSLPNAPVTLARWIEAPAALLPGTTMPDMGASNADARDMAAYLMTLR